MIMPSPSHRPTSQASGYTSGAKPSGMAKGTSALALVELVDDVAGEPADRQGRSDQQPDEEPLEHRHVPILRCRHGWPPPPTPRATADDAPRPPAYPAAMRTLVISVTSGVDRPEACNQALTVAAAAVAAVRAWLQASGRSTPDVTEITRVRMAAGYAGGRGASSAVARGAAGGGHPRRHRRIGTCSRSRGSSSGCWSLRP